MAEGGLIQFRVRGLTAAQHGLFLRAEVDRFNDDSWSKVRVEVDGHVVGWLNNPWQSYPSTVRNHLVRFIELELEIPYCFSAGRSIGDTRDRASEHTVGSHLCSSFLKRAAPSTCHWCRLRAPSPYTP